MAKTVKVKCLPHAEGLPLPVRATPHSSCVDLLAAIREEVCIMPGERALIPTGLVMEIPEGYEAQVRPRSGLALKHGIIVPNSPGTIDSDYRGEVGVILLNAGQEPFTIKRGERIAQLALVKTENIEFIKEENLTETSRRDGGFGHTGR